MPPGIKLFSRDPDPARRQIRLLPAHAFFTECVPLPEDPDAPPPEESAALLLEAEAPFPVEQLAWGCRLCPYSRQLLVFAAFTDRLPAGSDQPPLEAWRHTFPEFLALATDQPADAPRYGILTTDTSLVAWHAPAGSTQPDRLAARLRPDAADARSALERQLLAEVGCPDPERAISCRQPTADEPHHGQIHLRTQDGDERPGVHLAGDALWRADVRSPAFKQAERRGRRTDQRLWAGLLGISAAIALLLLGEVILLGLGLWAGNRAERIEARAPSVERLESQLDFVSQLEQRSTGAMQPFTVLAVMNEGRPETLYFTDAEATDFRQFSVEAIARSPGEVNAYVERLRGLPWFEQVDLEINAVSGQTRFTLNLVVASLPELAAAPATP